MMKRTHLTSLLLPFALVLAWTNLHSPSLAWPEEQAAKPSGCKRVLRSVLDVFGFAEKNKGKENSVAEDVARRGRIAELKKLVSEEFSEGQAESPAITAAVARVEKEIADPKYEFTQAGKPSPALKSLKLGSSNFKSADSIHRAFHDPALVTRYAKQLLQDTLARMFASQDTAAIELASQGRTSEAFVTKVLEERMNKHGFSARWDIKDCCATVAEFQNKILRRAYERNEFFFDPVQERVPHMKMTHAAQWDLAIQTVGEENFMELLRHMGYRGTEGAATWLELFDSESGPKAANNPETIGAILKKAVDIR